MYGGVIHGVLVLPFGVSQFRCLVTSMVNRNNEEQSTRGESLT